MKHILGFTLIEIMIALVILTLVSAGAVMGLNHMIRVGEKQKDHHERYQQLTQAYATISQDMFYAIMLSDGEQAITVNRHTLGFSRTMTDQRGEVVPVKLEYHWDKHAIKRRSDDHEVVVLSGLDDIQIMVITSDSAWREVDTMSIESGLPWAIKIIMHDENIGELTWSFTLPH